MELEAKKKELEDQVKEIMEQLEDEEEASAELSGVKQKMEQEMKDMKADIEDLEVALKKVSAFLLAKRTMEKFLCMVCLNKQLDVIRINIKERATMCQNLYPYTGWNRPGSKR